ncbi:hypothetical protein NBRC116188_26700 [Oceaniserpentilla sp. 4NH20-0058]|uniref:PilW family protein n=1 Tax=Oceaniserpentilla sp. 4NH20-0058 TaxID=3127660 RepID=UPI00310B8351
MKQQQGFTLIELMISGTIGIFVITGLLNLFITTNKTITLSDAMSRNQETGRFAMDYMTTFLRQAGYSEDSTQPLSPIFVSTGSTDNTLINCTDPAQAQACSVNNPENEPILGDRLSIPFNIGGNAGDESRACTGTIIGGTANGPQRLVTVFWVSSDEDTLNELRCRIFDRDANGWLDNPVSIINNVELFEFQIGVSQLYSDPHVSQYINVGSYGTQDITPDRIRSIRIALLTTSQETDHASRINSTSKERIYNLLDAPLYSVTDGNLRNIFMNTIELPNMIGGAM